MALATFSARINDLVGDFTDTNAMDTFLLDGLKEVLSILPPPKLAECSNSVTVNNDSGFDLDTTTYSNIISVTRKNQQGYEQICRPIAKSLSSRVSDPSDLMFASASDPVYYIDNAVCKVLPVPTTSQPAQVVYTPLPTYVDSSDTDIDNFPNEYEYIVVLYAAIKCAQSLLAIEEDDELYVPIITTLKQDYVQGLNLLGAKAQPPKGTGQKTENPLAAIQEAMQQQQGGQ
tara:strand:+ start:476 stop:1168 length:693 start_codon:yes stop_codon:yes gene_type:complete